MRRAGPTCFPAHRAPSGTGFRRPDPLAPRALRPQPLDQRRVEPEGLVRVDQLVEQLVIPGGGDAENLGDGLFLGPGRAPGAPLEGEHAHVTLRQGRHARLPSHRIYRIIGLIRPIPPAGEATAGPRSAAARVPGAGATFIV